jgi:hypothetical protein
MRLFFSVILFITLTLQINVCGQVSQAYEVGKEPKDKVLISGGKPVFVIAISPHLASDSFVTEREKNELQKNFKSLQADVRLEYTDVIIFKNKNTRKFDFQKSNESLERVFYWDGKVDSEPVVYEGLMNATEFFAQELNLDVVSSYGIDFEKLKEEYLTPPEEKITKRSKEVSDFFLNKTIMSYLFFLEKGSENFYKMNFKGIKSIKAVPSTSGKDVIPMEITFNEDGLPMNMNYTVGKNIKNFNFQYENGLIRNFQNGKNLFYVDHKIVEIDEDSRTVYAIKEEDFLVSRYDAFFDDTKKLYWREIDVDGNIISYKEEGSLNNSTYELASRKNIFPVIHRVAHSEKDNIIEKKGLEIIENYLPDNKIFNCTFNTKGLIEKMSFNDLDAKKKIKITYLYEYYK